MATFSFQEVYLVFIVAQMGVFIVIKTGDYPRLVGNFEHVKKVLFIFDLTIISSIRMREAFVVDFNKNQEKPHFV